MVQQTAQNGSIVWTATKPLASGDYQYKFIIDNVWRHDPEQPIIHDERGIINNCLSVKFETCGDVTCFCYSLYPSASSESFYNGAGSIASAQTSEVSQLATAVTQSATKDNSCFSDQPKLGILTPQTIKKFKKTTGVAFKYVEKEPKQPGEFPKSYMHTHINDRPFEVTVINVKNLAMSYLEPEANGMISRACSFDDLASPTLPSTVSETTKSDAATAAEDENLPANKESTVEIANCPAGRNRYLRYYQDPSLPIVEDPVYAAALIADKEGSIPHTAPYRAEILRNDPTELAYSIRARLSSPVFGFNPKECHSGIVLLDTNHCALRVEERGLYKTVRAVLPVPVISKCVYFEVFVYRQSTTGGVCVGLSTKELPLTCLVGTRPNSIGFSTNGNLIRTVDGKESWTQFGHPVDSGCTIGCLVLMDKVKNPSGEDVGIRARMNYYVNGIDLGVVEFSFQGVLAVFPTLSLFARNARVYSLFNAEDMLYMSALPKEGGDIYMLNGDLLPRDGEKGLASS